MSLEIVHSPRAHCSLVRPFVWELEWRPERPIYPGMEMELRCTPPRSFTSWRFVRSEVDKGDVTFRCKINPSVSERRANPNRTVLRARFQYAIALGEPVRLRLTAVPGMWLGVEPLLTVWIKEIPDNFNPDIEPPPPAPDGGSACRLKAGPGIVERLSVYSRPAPGPDGRVRTLLVPEDRYGNPSPFAKPVTAALRWNGAEQSVEISGTTTLFLDPPAEGVARAVCRIPLEALAVGEAIANGTPEGSGRVVTGNPVWRDGLDGRKAVFGEFHWHTDFSGDGQRPIREALRCAREELNLDFAAPGDHDPVGEPWDATVAALDAAQEPDVFATFFGWEKSSDRGHENYYFTDPRHPLRCEGEAGVSRAGRPSDALGKLEAVWEEREDFLAIPHHTNAVSETRKLEDDSPFWHPYPWPAPRPFLRMVEIMQTRGNMESNDCADAWRGWHLHNGSSAQDALRLGHRIGFTGGTDNHCGWPGRAFAENEGALVHAPKSVILTGLWTEANRRDEVFQALYERRSWAVWDTRALVDFRINGVPSGQELNVEPGAELTAHIRLSAEDALRTLDVVSEGTPVWSGATKEMDVEMELPLGRAERSTHFYLRALEVKGGILYASPVFVDVAGTE
jgi:hypothetical protein